jgi:hypothetical protein
MCRSERIPRDWHERCYLLCTDVYITRNGSRSDASRRECGFP